MELNPKKALADLEAAYCTYVSSTTEQRGELAVTLQRSINRCDVEIGNLSRDAATDFEKRMLYKRLICTVELIYACGIEGGTLVTMAPIHPCTRRRRWSSC